MWSPPHPSSASHLRPCTFPCTPSCNFCRLWGFWHGTTSYPSFSSTSSFLRRLCCTRQPCNKVEQDVLAKFSCEGYCLNDQKSVLLFHILVLHLRLPLGRHSRCVHFTDFIPTRYLPVGKNITILIALTASGWHLDNQQQLRSLNASRGVFTRIGGKLEGGATGSGEKTGSWCDLISGLLHCSLCQQNACSFWLCFPGTTGAAKREYKHAAWRPVIFKA